MEIADLFFCGRRDSNPHKKLGRLLCYHYTTPAFGLVIIFFCGGFWDIKKMGNMESFTKTRESFSAEYKKIQRINGAIALLQWDAETIMPKASRENRAEQIATLAAIEHGLSTGDGLRKLFENTNNEFEKLSKEEQLAFPTWKREAQVFQKEWERKTKLSEDFVGRWSKLTSISQGVWEKARNENDWKSFEPVLAEVITLSKRKTELFGFSEEPYNALLEEFEEGITGKQLEDLFLQLKKDLIPIVKQGKKFSNPFPHAIAIEKQQQFNEKLPIFLGLQKDHYRLDTSAHPFSTTIGKNDQRITTRYSTSDPISSIFGILHETGHSLYEAGLSTMEDYPSILSQALSFGIHESQSRLWENLIGRSAEFWEYYYPTLLKDFGLTETEVPLKKFLQFVNSVEPSLIRVEADPVTYNLHIILRFELERDLLNGKIHVVDLPELWNQKIQESFGLKVSKNSEGVLQDVHWSAGYFGYFPTYSLGNIYASQIFDAFCKQNSNFLNSGETKGTLSKTGDLSGLLEFLRSNLHRLGRIESINDTIVKITSLKPDSKFLLQDLQKIVKLF